MYMNINNAKMYSMQVIESKIICKKCFTWKIKFAYDFLKRLKVATPFPGMFVRKLLIREIHFVSASIKMI